jgi:hypothetical protein
LPAPVRDAYQKAVDSVFHAAGFTVKQAAIKRHDGHAGHTVEVDGLQLSITHTVKGTHPITIALPPGVPCPLPHSLPLDVCSGVGLSLNAKYRGQIGLGELTAVSLAQPPDKQPACCSPGPGPGEKTPPPGPGPSTGGNPGFSGGGGGNPGTQSHFGGGGGNDGGATVAGNTYTVADPLSGLQHRIWWFFPLIAISLLSLLGRFRFPARLPSQ